MALDRNSLRENLRSFYKFAGKTVIYVGAGGGQLLDASFGAKKIIAVDRDADSLTDFRTHFCTTAKGSDPTEIEVIASRFETVSHTGDVVYFEFCLHEMEDPWLALMHAAELAEEIVVFDHVPHSEWSWLAAEEHKVFRSGVAMLRFGRNVSIGSSVEQRFQDYDELVGKLRAQGPIALQRTRKYADRHDIAIRMPFEVVLLKRRNFKSDDFSRSRK